MVLIQTDHADTQCSWNNKNYYYGIHTKQSKVIKTCFGPSVYIIIGSRVQIHRGTAIHPKNSPNINEWGLSMTPLVTQEEFWALETAMVKIGRLAAVGALNACETFRHSFSCRLVDDSQVCDRCLGSTGLGFR